MNDPVDRAGKWKESGPLSSNGDGASREIGILLGKWTGPLCCPIDNRDVIGREPLSPAAAEAGVPETIIIQRTGRRSISTLARYARPATVFSVDPLARAL